MAQIKKIDLKDLSFQNCSNRIASLGKEKYRTPQLLKWLYSIGVRSFDEMTNLSKTSGRS